MIKKLRIQAEKYVTKNKTSVHRRPSHDGTPESRAEMEYYSKTMMWLFSQAANGKTWGSSIMSSSYDKNIIEARNYANGEIDINKYKNLMLGKDNKGKQRTKGYINISWRPDLGYLKTLDIMTGAYEKINYEPSVRALDPGSTYTRQTQKGLLELMTKKSYQNHLQKIGVKPPGMDEIPVLKSKADVELFEQAGGITLKPEIAMKKALNVSENQSKIDVLKSMWFDDIKEIGWAVGKDYVDMLDNIAKVRYVDPAYYLTPCSKYLDFRDVTIGGELRLMSISEIRRESRLEENQLIKIAADWGYSSAGNLFNTSSHEKTKEETGQYPYDHFQIWVLDGGWLSSEIIKRTEVTNNYGALSYNKVDSRHKMSKDDKRKGKKKVKNLRKQYTYKCMWIVGTEYSFNYGKEYYQKDKKHDPSRVNQLPFHAVRISSKAKVSRMIADIDEINILTYKRRNAIASIPAPPGLIINQRALEEVNLKGVDDSPTALIKMMIESGILLVSNMDDHDNPISNLNQVIGTIPDKILNQFAVYSQLIDEKRRNIQITTGINDVTDGTSTAERQLKVVGESKLEASNNAMQPEYSAMKTLIERCWENIMVRWQVIVKYHNVKANYRPLDAESMEIITITSVLSSAKFGLAIKLGPTYEEKVALLNRVAELRKIRNTSGAGGISEGVYIMIYRQIMSGNLPLAQWTLAREVEHQKIEDEQEKRKIIEYTTKQQIESAQAAEASKRKTMIVEKAAEMIVNNQIAQNKLIEIVLTKDLETDGAINEEQLKATVDNILSSPDNQLNKLQSLVGTS